MYYLTVLSVISLMELMGFSAYQSQKAQVKLSSGLGSYLDTMGKKKKLITIAGIIQFPVAVGMK